MQARRLLRQVRGLEIASQWVLNRSMISDSVLQLESFFLGPRGVPGPLHDSYRPIRAHLCRRGAAAWAPPQFGRPGIRSPLDRSPLSTPCTTASSRACNGIAARACSALVHTRDIRRSFFRRPANRRRARSSSAFAQWTTNLGQSR